MTVVVGTDVRPLDAVALIYLAALTSTREKGTTLPTTNPTTIDKTASEPMWYGAWQAIEKVRAR